MADLKESRRQDGEFVSYFEKYGSIAALDREVLERLLDYVAVEDGFACPCLFQVFSGS